MSSRERSVRFNQLRKVFLKALDVSVESFGPLDTRECFAPVRETLGQNAIEGVVVKQLGKLNSNIEVKYMYVYI